MFVNELGISFGEASFPEYVFLLEYPKHSFLLCLF